MSAALSIPQKRYLSQLARRAMFRTRALALGRGEAWTAGEDAWRQAEVAQACGKLGLRCCSQDDFGAVEAHFFALLGAEGQAVKAAVHGDPEANRRRIVEWKIVQQCARMGRGLHYANAICRRMTDRDLLDTPTNQLWWVFYALEKEYRRVGNRTFKKDTRNAERN